MNEELVFYYLSTCGQDNPKSLSTVITERNKEISEFLLQKLQENYNQLAAATRDNLDDICKLKALFHHHVVNEIGALRLLDIDNNAETKDIAADWHDVKIINDLYAYKGKTFLVTFSKSSRVEDWFLVSVANHENRELTKCRCVGKMPTCNPNNKADDTELVNHIIKIFHDHFQPFFEGVVNETL